MYLNIPTSELFRDFSEQPIPKLVSILSKLSFNNVSDPVTGGSTGTNVDKYFFVAPCKMIVTKATFIVDVANVGADNTPAVSLREGSNQVGISAAIALSGAAGDVHNVVLDPAKVEIAKGAKLFVRVATPSATISTALVGKLQIEWNAIP